MPYITEEIWQSLPHEGESIMVSSWPEYDEAHCFESEAAQFTKVMDAIKAIRNRRAQMNVPPSKKATLYIETANAQVFERCAAFLVRLASASEVEVNADFDKAGAVQVITDSAKIYIPMAELIDMEKEAARLAKEKEQCEKQAAGLEARLNNPGFVNKAPENVVAAERDRLAKLKERLAKLEESIAAMK